MNRLGKAFALILVAMLAFVAVGCSSPSAQQQSSSAQQSASSALSKQDVQNYFAIPEVADFYQNIGGALNTMNTAVDNKDADALDALFLEMNGKVRAFNSKGEVPASCKELDSKLKLAGSSLMVAIGDYSSAMKALEAGDKGEYQKNMDEANEYVSEVTAALQEVRAIIDAA